MEEGHQEKKMKRLEQKVDDLTQTTYIFMQQIIAYNQKKINELPNNQFRFKLLQSFNGENPHRWLNKAELYFRVNKTSTDDDMKKLDYAQDCMEGDCEDWFTLIRRRNTNLTWSEFKELLMERFGGSKSPYLEICEIKQQHLTVDEYLKKFEKLAVMSTQLSESKLKNYLIDGFRDEIQTQLMSLRFDSEIIIEQVIRVARLYEADPCSLFNNGDDPLQQKVQELTKKLSDTQQTIAEMKHQMISTEKKKKNNEPELFVCNFNLRFFNGENPNRWLNKEELYFRLNETPPSKKLDVAEICMEGDCEDWFALLLRRNPNLSWSEFKELLVDQFGSRLPNTQLYELKQNHSTVDEYLKKFEKIAVMTKLSESDCIDYLIEGFRDEIKTQVMTSRYDDSGSERPIEQIIRLARYIEDKFDDKDRKQNTKRSKTRHGYT